MEFRTKLNYSEYVLSTKTDNREVYVRLNINFEDDTYTILPMYQDEFIFKNGNNLEYWNCLAELIKEANTFAFKILNNKTINKHE